MGTFRVLGGSYCKQRDPEQMKIIALGHRC